MVPPFFAHEGTVLARLEGEAVPRLLGHDGPRMLLPELPGDDRYDAPLPELLAMVDLLVGLQARWLDRTDELVALGLPDWRGVALAQGLADIVTVAASTSRATSGHPRCLRGRLARRTEAIAGCGIGDTLVHGDFHPGNIRGDATRLVLLDWGEAASAIRCSTSRRS